MNCRPATIAFCLAMAAGLFICAGCNVGYPRMRGSDNIYQRQLQDTYHDPYGSVSGAPEIDGARPDEYDIPRALPVQSQWFN